MAQDDKIEFIIGYTDLQALAEEHGLTYERSNDGERVLRSDGTAVIDVRLPPKQPKKKGAPSVWMRSIRFHTYDGHPQEAGAVYLAREAEVENIINMKFAVKERPPRRAGSSPTAPAVPVVPLEDAQPADTPTTDTPVMTPENTPALVPRRRRGRQRP